HGQAHGSDRRHDHHASAGKLTDPVCGMSVDPVTAKHKAEHAGQSFYFCSAGCKAKFEADPTKYLSNEAPAADGAHVVKDPVCGMSVDPHTAKHRAEHAGRTYYFCSAGCKAKFEADPERYLSPEQRRQEPVPEGTIYTCPMHPEVRQVGPGSCPICGMALEPELVTAETGPNPELVDMTRRLWIGAVLTIP